MFTRFHWALRSLPRDSALLRAGQLLAAAGLLVLSFVGYRQWGTAIEASQSQERLGTRFEAIAAGPAAEPDAGTKPATSVATSVDQVDDPGGAAADPDTDLAWTPVPVTGGDPVALIEAPTIGLSRYVVAGVSVGDLKRGPGHFPGTAQPGHLGNVAIAGHRTTYGEPFRNLDELVGGDEIWVTDLRGRKFRYLVTDSFVVEPSDTWVVDTVDPKRGTLTLTTCHPEFSNRQRLVITAELADVASAVDDRPFRYPGEDLAGTGEPTDGATTIDGTVPGGDTVDGAGGDGTAGAVAAPVVTAPAATGVVDAGEGVGADATVAAFDEDWFDDIRAWPHVIGWLLALVLVVLAWRVLRYRRGGVLFATAAVAAPFLVTLYFTFQNVNRLLPSYL